MTAARGPSSGPQGNPLAALLGGGAKSTRLGAAALVGIGVTGIILARTIWPWVQLRTSPPAPVSEKAQNDALESQFETAMDGYVDQVIGRAPFHLPGPSKPKVVASNEPTTRPSRYGGPSIQAMINNKVWFSDGSRLGPDDDAKDGIKVVSLNAPWSAKVRWQGAEFDVEFFQRSPLLSGNKWMPESGASAESPSPAPSHSRDPSFRGSPAAEAKAGSTPRLARPGQGEPIEEVVGHPVPPPPTEEQPGPGSAPAAPPQPAPTPAPAPEPTNPGSEPANTPAANPPATPPTEPESKRS